MEKQRTKEELIAKLTQIDYLPLVIQSLQISTVIQVEATKLMDLASEKTANLVTSILETTSPEQIMNFFLEIEQKKQLILELTQPNVITDVIDYFDLGGSLERDSSGKYLGTDINVYAVQIFLELVDTKTLVELSVSLSNDSASHIFTDTRPTPEETDAAISNAVRALDHEATRQPKITKKYISNLINEGGIVDWLLDISSLLGPEVSHKSALRNSTEIENALWQLNDKDTDEFKMALAEALTRLSEEENIWRHIDTIDHLLSIATSVRPLTIIEIAEYLKKRLTKSHDSSVPKRQRKETIRELDYYIFRFTNDATYSNDDHLYSL